jgi:putative ABC transport system permease protein
LLVAAVLILLGVIATSHALIVTVRRRRLELGVLSALGFTPTQRRVVVVAQATTIAIVALVVGIPLGAVAGRLIWSAIASTIGLAADAVFPFALVALGAVGFLITLNVIAVFPAHTARRLRAASALRSE